MRSEEEEKDASQGADSVLRDGEKGATYMHIHRDFYDLTLAPKREIDVLRAISPAGSHL